MKDMGRYQRAADIKAVDTKREALHMLLERLALLQTKAGIVATNQSTGSIPDDPPDDMPVEEEDDGPQTRNRRSAADDEDPAPTPVEHHIICLPSNLNVQGDYRALELHHRKLQAKTQLNRLRDLVADRSFQFSHVMRTAPNKGVRTRSRTAVAKTNLEVHLVARRYRRCRARMAALGADDATLNTFRILLKGDLDASTAVLKPNMPGSTQLKLPWIWHTSTGHLPAAGFDQFVDDQGAADAGTLLECMSVSSSYCSVINLIQSQTRALVAGPGYPAEVARRS